MSLLKVKITLGAVMAHHNTITGICCTHLIEALLCMLIVQQNDKCQ